MLNIWCHFNDTLENEKAENFDWVSKVLTGKKKSISQPAFCSVPSLNGKSAKKSQIFFKIVFTKLSSIVGLSCLEKVSTIWWAQSDLACLALLARFTLVLVKKSEKVTFVLQAKRGSAIIAFWRRSREKFGGQCKNLKYPAHNNQMRDRLLCSLREQHQDLNRLNDIYKTKTKT